MAIRPGRGEVGRIVDLVLFVEAQNRLFVKLLPVAEGHHRKRSELEAGGGQQDVIGDLLPRRVVFLEQVRRHHQGFAGIGEALARRRIDRKGSSRADIDPGQVANGVVVLGIAESSRRRSARIIRQLAGLDQQKLVDGGQEFGALRGGGLFGLLGRHLLFLQERDDMFPFPKVLSNQRAGSVSG